MRKVLISLIVVLALLLAGLLGFIWFDSTHFFVEGEPYAYYAKELDLREKEISEAHYLTVQAQIPECQILWNVPVLGTTYSSDTEVVEISTMVEEDIRILGAYFPNLTTVNASACREYELLKLLTEQLPDCDVLYQVDLGGTSVDPEAVEATLAPGSYDFDLMMENLVHLPSVQKLIFPRSELTGEQTDLLAEQYPEIEIVGTVELLGREYDVSTTSLDLSAMTPAQVDAAASRLGMLTALETVELMDASGASKLSMADVKKLKDAAPHAAFHYVFDFYGVTISTTDEEVKIKGIKVEDGKLEENLRLALGLMTNCKRFILDAKGPYDKIWKEISLETLAKLREEFRDQVKLVWRVYFGKNGSALTDVEVLRAVYGLVDDNSSSLKYLEECRYMDIGHNDQLDYMDFVSGMVNLEAVIISGAPVKSLEPFANCKNLKFLEMANCRYVPTLDPLKECTQLEMLNISETEIADISPLEDLNLTHLNTIHNNVPEEDIEAYIEAHPDCWTVTKGNHYGVGWRYDTDEQTLLDWYAKLDAEYHYISGKNIPNNVGWYLD